MLKFVEKKNKITYPNGALKDGGPSSDDSYVLKELLRSKYNKTFYDPATTKEANYRKTRGIEKTPEKELGNLDKQ